MSEIYEQVRWEYPGADLMSKRGYKRLASRVWQKVFPSGTVFRAMVSEDFLWVDVTIVR